MKVIRFQVGGIPVPKQSTRFDGHGHAHTDPRVKGWQDTVSLFARLAMEGVEPIVGPVALKLEFFMPNKRRADCDNLAKGTMDALRQIVFGDDSQVIELHITKQVDKDAPGVRITAAPV